MRILWVKISQGQVGVLASLLQALWTYHLIFHQITCFNFRLNRPPYNFHFLNDYFVDFKKMIMKMYLTHYRTPSNSFRQQILPHLLIPSLEQIART